MACFVLNIPYMSQVRSNCFMFIPCFQPTYRTYRHCFHCHAGLEFGVLNSTSLYSLQYHNDFRLTFPFASVLGHPHSSSQWTTHHFLLRFTISSRFFARTPLLPTPVRYGPSSVAVSKHSSYVPGSYIQTFQPPKTLDGKSCAGV